MNIAKIPGHEKDALMVVRERTSRNISPTRPLSMKPITDDEDDEDYDDEAADTLHNDLVGFFNIYIKLC